MPTPHKSIWLDIPVDAVVVVVVCGIVLLYYHVQNSNRDVERFYHKHHKPKYSLLIAAYTVIVLSMWSHARFLVDFIFRKLFSGFKRI